MTSIALNAINRALDAKQVPLLTVSIAMRLNFHLDIMALTCVIVSVASDGMSITLSRVILVILPVWIVVLIVVAPCVTKTAPCQSFSIASVFTNVLQAIPM